MTSLPCYDAFRREEFEGNTFWIAGGSAGIGRAVAGALARLGARLVVSSRDGAKLARVREELLAEGASDVVSVTVPLEAGDLEARVAHGLQRAHPGGTPLAGVLLNGGGPHGGRFETLTASDFDDAHELLLKGPARLFAALRPALRRATAATPGASVVAITSTTVKEPNVDLPLSATYRTALVALLKNASFTLGADGIRVNNLAPGYTDTARLQELRSYVAKRGLAGAGSAANTPSLPVGDAEHNAAEAERKVQASWAALAALGRVADPEEIAQAALFLFSRASSFVTGQTLVVDGGQVRGY